MEALKKDETIGVRVSAVNKEMIALAASYKGQDVSSYMMGLVMEHVYKDIKEHKEMQRMLLEEDAFNSIVHDIENPPKANSKLLEAAARHRQKKF